MQYHFEYLQGDEEHKTLKAVFGNVLFKMKYSFWRNNRNSKAYDLFNKNYSDAQTFYRENFDYFTEKYFLPIKYEPTEN